MNKKAEGAGFTIEQLMKILISVAVIVALFYLAFKLYGIFSTSTKVEQAKANLDELSAKINSVNEGEKIDFLITGPKDWYMIYFSEQMPSKCKNFKCICFCEENSKESCDLNGACKVVDDNLRFMIQFLEETYLTLDTIRAVSIEKTNGKISISTKEKNFGGLTFLNDYLKQTMAFDNEEKSFEEWIVSFGSMSEADFKNVEKQWSDSTREFFNKEPGGKWAIIICYPEKEWHSQKCWIAMANNNEPRSEFYLNPSEGPIIEAYKLKIPSEKGDIELKLNVLK